MKKFIALFLIIITIFSLTGCKNDPRSSAEDALLAYLETVFLGEAEDIPYLFPEEFWALIQRDNSQASPDFCIARYSENWKESQKKFGEDFQVSFEIIGKEDMTKEKSQIQAGLEKNYNIEFEPITQVYRIEYHITLTSSKYTDSDSHKPWACKIGNSWYICEDGDDDTYYFLAEKIFDYILAEQ